MRALVTGANGFLGRHVVSALLGRGIEVRAMVRPAARLEALGWPSSVEVFRADLRTSRDLGRAFEGIDVLLHLAAVVSGGEEAQFAGTVVGTERLLDAMATSNCRRLVLCSSFTVYDHSSIGRILDEASPIYQAPDVYTRDGYTVAKWWQERVTRRFAEKHGWDLIVLRPGVIWGRDRSYLAALGQQFGWHHLVIGPLTRMPLTHVENCADVFALAAGDARARGQTLNVVDGPGERVWTYLADYMRGSGRPGWRFPVPYWLAIRVVRLAFVTVFRSATKLPGTLIPRRFESRFRPLRFENRRLRETLGWIPPLDYQQCLKLTYGPAAPAASGRCGAMAPTYHQIGPAPGPGRPVPKGRFGVNDGLTTRRAEEQPMNQETRKKVLLLCYRNNPDDVSLPLVSYREYEQLRKHFDTTLVTHVRDASALRKSGIPDGEAIYINVPILDRLHDLFLAKVLKYDYGSQKLTAFLIPYYIVYEFVIWFRLRSEIKAGRFALVHRLNPMSPVLASPFAWLMRNLKTPFSLGPMNGGLPWPPGYTTADREKEWTRFLRWLYIHLPFSRSTYTKSKAVIVGSSYNYLAAGRRVERNRLFFVQENGIPAKDIVVGRRYDDMPPVRVCFLGRLVPFKNCNIVIQSAAALIKEKKIQLDIVGDGWDRSNLLALTRDLDLEKDVTFHGSLPHPQAMGILARSHIMAFPSIRELGGNVVVEAMARGVVPIVVRYGGPSDQVEEGCGISLALKNERETVQDLKRVLEELVNDPDRIRQLGEAARVKAGSCTWERKAELLAAVMNYAMGVEPRPALAPNKELLSQYDSVTVQ